MPASRKRVVFHSTAKRKTQVIRRSVDFYVRPEIPCRAATCVGCKPFVESEGVSEPLLLSEDPKLQKLPNGETRRCFLFLDADAVSQGIDVLNDEAFADVLLLQTTVGEVRAESEPTFRKLRDLMSDRNRRIVVFLNEFFTTTALPQAVGESDTQYTQRLSQVAWQWLAEHWSVTCPNVTALLLTGSDVQPPVEKKAKNSVQLQHETLQDFVSRLPNAATLSVRLDERIKEVEEQKAEGGFAYPEHLTKTQIREGVRNSKLTIGRFRGSRENYLEGCVVPETSIEEDQGILVQGLEDLNRAIDNDIVAVEVYPESKWGKESGWIAEDEAVLLGEEETETGTEQVLETTEDNLPLKDSHGSKKPTGRIVGIVQRRWREYCGVLEHDGSPHQNICLFRPADRRIPKIRVHSKYASELAGQKLMVSIDYWTKTSRYPAGHVVKSLGNTGDRATENEVLLIEHDVPHSTFSSAVLECLPAMPWKITEQDRKERWDLRDREICSVDPPGCTDIDDALHCRVLDNGNFEVGVHIADVTHFIRPGTAIDREAASRGTTVYLVDNRIDMVPELLSSNLCSLLGRQERFAFSVLWEMVPNTADVLSVKFGKSIIKSRDALTYEAAQLRIDDVKDTSEVTKGLRRLNKLAKMLKKKRMDAGALLLASSEVRFQLDSVTREPIQVESKEMRDTNSMVEEFMLLANTSVAEKTKAAFPLCAMLRKHPEPPQSNFEPVVNAAKAQGFVLDPTTGKTLATSLDAAVIHEQPYFNSLLRMLTTRSMMQAVYFAAGTQVDTRHYGLASPLYTHFTSPIRRYADVMVHRYLAACIGADQKYPSMLDKTEVQKIANNLNYRHKMAQYAGRASVNLNTHFLFRGKTIEEQAYVFDLRKNAVQVFIPKYGLEERVMIPKDLREAYVVDDVQRVADIGGVRLSCFQAIVVRITMDESNANQMKLLVQLINPKIPGLSPA